MRLPPSVPALTAKGTCQKDRNCPIAPVCACALTIQDEWQPVSSAQLASAWLSSSQYSSVLRHNGEADRADHGAACIMRDVGALFSGGSNAPSPVRMHCADLGRRRRQRWQQAVNAALRGGCSDAQRDAHSRLEVARLPPSVPGLTAGT